jgi:hypothetical protein
MSTMAKNDPIPVDDQSRFFRQIVDSSLALLHTARPGAIFISSISIRRSNIDLRSKLSFCNVRGLSRL